MNQIVLETRADAPRVAVSDAVTRAIAERVGNLDATLRLLELSLREHELKHGMFSAAFYQKYQNGDELPDTNEFQVWAGEYELSQKLGAERDLLAGVRVCPSPIT